MNCLLVYDERPPHPLLAKRLHGTVVSDRMRAGDWVCVFRWGSTAGSDGNYRVVNSARAVRNARGSDWATTLRLNDIACNSTAEPRWRVYLFDLRTVGVVRLGGRRRYHVGNWQSPPLVAVRDVARRALYAAGLHFGAVDVSVAGNGRPSVVRLLPAPPLDARLAGRFARSMDTYAAVTKEGLAASEGRSPAVEAVLGADPEFILRHRRTGRTVSAGRFFSRWGVVGLDRARFRRHGQWIYPLAEVRPPPSSDPLQLIENLRRAIAMAARAVRGHPINFQAGGTSLRDFTIGGHIHFSNVRLSTDLLRALDNYLALPVLFLENPRSCRLRRPRYGFLGDWRPQPHGGFEYRTPGSWLISPQYAAAVLCLAKAIVQDYPLLRRDVLASPENQRAFYRVDKDALRPHFFSLWRDLQKSSVFQEFAPHIRLIYDMVLEERRWNERVDLKRRWLTG